MSNLRNILNPDDGRKDIANVYPDYDTHPSAGDLPSSPASVTSGNTTVEGAQEEIAHQDHEPHPNCPDTLDCLPDTDGRPQHTLPVILRCAILGSPRKRLTIREIYAAMEGKYSYYKTAGQTWKQSVRHHLSLNRLFERQPRPVTDPGFGSYWTVNLEAPPGTKRPRKRGRPNKDAESQNPAKRRGRPRKEITATPGTGVMLRQEKMVQDGDDYEMMAFDDDAEPIPSDDEEYESEEDPSANVHPFERRPSLVGLNTAQQQQQQAPTSAGSSSGAPRSMFSTFPEEDASSIIERLNVENQTLRRQSADAVQLSIRLTDQLSQAQSESSRTKASLKTIEEMLGDESRKRREAENLADEEARMRRALETELRQIRGPIGGSPMHEQSPPQQTIRSPMQSPRPS